MHSVTVEELKKVIALSDLPDEHIQWILDRSEYYELEDGNPVAKYGDPALTMFIILEGKVSFYMNVNGRQVYYYTFENNTATGGVGGMMPYSRMKTHPGNSYATGKVRLIRFHKDHFSELEQLNPDLIQRLIGYMTERARSFATTQLQHEKVNALGKLAAGIAHEINNPAAAINSISTELRKRLNYNYQHTEKLLQFNVNPKQLENLRLTVEKKTKEFQSNMKLTAIQRMELEDDMVDWLDKKGVENDREAAETFTEFGFSIAVLEDFCQEFEKDALVHVLQWLENLLSSQILIQHLDEASSRISSLVGAIKSHVHMDRTNELQPTNIHTDIDNTLTLLGYKLREKNIEVRKDFAVSMPPVPVYVGEMNQVWTNLFDNAIFAMEKNGELTIKTSFENGQAKICIMDNGAGIPKEIMSRIFDPFFTTKKVGEGTGIGLDTVSRIVKHHNGEINVTSVPGKTEFIVCLPLAKK